MKMGRPLLRAAWTQNAEPWEKAPGLRVSFLRKRLAKDFWSRLILLFSPEADVPAGNSSQLLQLAILGSPSHLFCPCVPVIPQVSFSVPLFWASPVSFSGLASWSFPQVSFSVPLFWAAPVIFFVLAFRSFPQVGVSVPLFWAAPVIFFVLAFRSFPQVSFSVPLFWPIPGRPSWPIILYILGVSLDYWA
ncbi:MAG: hypothetical protein ACOX8F_00080 [Sakamotonia sp.]|jgi:hypothetical protein